MNNRFANRGVYLLSQVGTRIVAALLGVYAARVLGPRQLGLWAAFQILYLYTGQAHLGTVNAMLREVPVARAQRNEGRARELVEATWGFVWVAATLTAVATGLGVWLAFQRWAGHAAALTIACAALAFVQLQSVFFNFYCFAFSEFAKLAVGTLLQQFLTTVACILLLAKYGVTGYLASMAIGFAAMWIAIWFGPLTQLRPRFASRSWQALISTGLPMLPGALMLYFGTTLDRLFVASRLGVAALGLFTVGAFLFQFGAAFWDMLIYTTYARLAALHASSSDDPDALVHVIGRALPGGIWLSSALQGILYICAPVLIAAILPR